MLKNFINNNEKHYIQRQSIKPVITVCENLFSFGSGFRWHILDTTLYPAYAKPAHRTEQKAIFSTNLLSSPAITNINNPLIMHFNFIQKVNTFCSPRLRLRLIVCKETNREIRT